MIVHIAFDLPARKQFDYLNVADAILPPVGSRVLAPFGNAERIGIVTAICETSQVPLLQLRPLHAQLSDAPALPAELIQLLLQIAERWLLPVGKLVFAALPPLLRKVRPTPLPMPDPRTRLPAELVPFGPDQLDQSHRPTLDALQAGWGKFTPLLLAGASRSGNEQFILAAISGCINRGRTALVLVPEIKHTAYWQKYLREHLAGCTIAVTHSKSTPKQRVASWLGTLAGNSHVIVGTRNAVLYPIADLGLVVVVDESDPLYRAERGLSFPARDAAAICAKLASCPLLLTATVPSLELYHAAQHKRLALTLLPPPATRPHVELIDIANRRLFGGVSVEMENALRRELRREGLSVILINRRGHGNMLYCEECRQLLCCKRCLRKLSQRSADECYCHFCGNVSKMPSICPACGGPQPECIRPGSMRIAETLAARFSDARIVRIDADAVAEQVQGELDRGAVDIVVGTKALLGYSMAPGTCIFSDADSMLASPNFKAAEQLLRILAELAARPSVQNLVVQTRQHKHHVFAALRSGNYNDFARAELDECTAAGLPPFRRFAMLSASSKDASELARSIGAAHTLIKQCVSDAVTLFEPVAAAGLGKMQLLLTSTSRSALHQTLKQSIDLLEKHRFPSGFNWELRLDPETW